MPHLTVTVTEFKAKCLTLLDDISKSGSTITITKRGRPLATAGPVSASPWKSPEGMWAGKVTIVGDLMESSAERWEVLHESLKAGS